MSDRGGCGGGECVEVEFTSCEHSACVKVGHAHGTVLVYDTKRPELPPISFTPDTWRRLLDRVKAEETINWDGVFFPLDFTAAEIEAFVKRACAGELDRPEAADAG